MGRLPAVRRRSAGGAVGRRRRRIEQGRGLDPIERAAPGEIASRRDDPVRRGIVVGQAHDLGQRAIDLAALEHPLGTGDAIGRQRRGLAGAPHDDEAAELLAEALPPALPAGACRWWTAWRDGIEPVLQIGERHRLACGGEDHRHRLRLALAEALAQQPLDIAELDAAIERAPRREGDEQPLGARGVSGGGTRLILDIVDLALQRGDLVGEGGIGDGGCDRCGCAAARDRADDDALRLRDLRGLCPHRNELQPVRDARDRS